MDEGFDCDIYSERRPLSRDWVLALWQQLWQRGARINSPQLAATWDEQLTRVFPNLPYTHLTLTDHIDRMVKDGTGSLHFWDRHACFTIDIDSTFQQVVSWIYDEPDSHLLNELPFGLIRLSLDSPQADDLPLAPDLFFHPVNGPTVEYVPPATAYLLRPKYQAHLAVAHWLEVVCRSLDPIYAMGYHDHDRHDDNAFWSHHHQLVVRALAQDELPTLEPLLERTPLLYAGPRFLTTERIRSWASQEGQSVRLLPNGGLLAYHSPEPYDSAVAEEFLTRIGEASLHSLGPNAYSTGGKTSRAPADHLAYLRRAREIVALYSEESEERPEYRRRIEYCLNTLILALEREIETNQRAGGNDR
jgi:hypothetical protein